MGRIILITGYFDVSDGGRPTGRKELMVSHGVDEETWRNVVLPCEHPKELGATFDNDLCEWVLPDPATQARAWTPAAMGQPIQRTSSPTAPTPAAPKLGPTASAPPRRLQMFRR